MLDEAVTKSLSNISPSHIAGAIKGITKSPLSHTFLISSWLQEHSNPTTYPSKSTTNTTSNSSNLTEVHTTSRKSEVLLTC